MPPEFLVLGPLEIRVDGAELRLGRTREQRIMAALLLDAGRVVPLDRLVDAVWDTAPPGTAGKLVRNCVSALRARLGNVPGIAIATHPAGYALHLGGAYLDAADFAARAARARELAESGAVEESVAEARAALALWRGPALAGLRVSAIEAAVGALDERRIRTAEECMSAELALGKSAELVAELSQLVADEPLRERPRAQLMQALYRCGRRAEALQTYREGRRVLVEQLGIEPGPELQQLERDILNDAPSLGVAPAAVSRPAQLPAAPASFTGRDELLRDLDTATGVALIRGTAGVGKTALAVHWAHRARGRFPDGQLFVNLYGYGVNPPLPPAAALAHFLRALGVPAEQVPVDVDEAAALYRTMLADRRVLVVVDNAATADQVRPLLPGGRGCLVLVTSRTRLPGLVARDDARPLTVGVLTAAEADALLRRLTGDERIAVDPDAAAKLATLCAFLPLALRVAAGHLVDRPNLGIAAYADQLAEGDRLAALTAEGDELSAVPAAIGLSYTALEEREKLVFRRLGLMPGADLSTAAVAVLTGLPQAAAEDALARLAAAHLAEEHAPSRYTFHDLLREYAAARCTDEDRTAASDLTDWYQRQADAAAAALYPEIVRLRRPDVQNNPGSRADALAWLNAERANLVAVAGRAGWPLSDALRGYFHLGMDTVGWLAVATAALADADRTGDLAAQAGARLSLGDLHWRMSNYPRSMAEYAAAEQLAGRAGWLLGQSAVLGNLGNVYQQSGALADAADRYRKAFAIAEEAGWAGGQAANLENLGAACWELGRLDEAAEHYNRSAELFAAAGSRFSWAIAVSGLGEVRHAQGRFAEASAHLADALVAHREVGNRGGEAETIRLQAAVARDEDRLADALSLADEALRLAREAGDRRFEADALNTLASIQSARGRDAGPTYAAALALATEIGNRYPEAEALLGLGDPDAALAVAEDAGYGLLAARARRAGLREGR
jgi:DNA-binding SARP family transcriptional activator